MHDDNWPVVNNSPIECYGTCPILTDKLCVIFLPVTDRLRLRPNLIRNSWPRHSEECQSGNALRCVRVLLLVMTGFQLPERPCVLQPSIGYGSAQCCF
jgi:hypothetical protein